MVKHFYTSVASLLISSNDLAAINLKLWSKKGKPSSLAQST